MKKIFAIALALVMVLSMASAFALNACSTFDWTCPADVTKCGKAKIEVVPYVLVNDGCGGTKYEVSTCATAIKTQDVFFAVKLTVDANADLNWWNEAWFEVKTKGVDLATFTAPAATLDAEKLDKVQEFYLKNNKTEWVLVDDDFEFGADYVFVTEVTDAKKAEVCAVLKSEHKGFETWEYGDYTVEVATNTDATGKYGMITVTNECNAKVEITWEKGKVTGVYATSEAFRAEVFAKFGLAGCGTGTCIDKDIIQKNFGWKDEVKSCFKWSDKGASVVNPECVVTLPKTGDASLLWWLF